MRSLSIVALLLVMNPASIPAQSAWPTHHRDFRNSDYTPFPATADLEVAWTALDGYAILTAPTIGPDGSVYVTTGKEHSGNLHAFIRYGRHLWTHPGIDSKAVTSSPLIDDRGVIFIADHDQLWAVNPDGSTKWTSPVLDSFGTAFLIGSNGIGGITLDGLVMLFDRESGSQLAPAYQIPGAVPDPPENLPDLLNGLIDPAIARTVVAGLLGYGSLVNNTPAIYPGGNLVLIITGDGFLHGLSVTPGQISPVYQIPVGPNAGSSPALSPDGNDLYFVGGDGYLQCHDTQSGALKFRIFTGTSFASPSIDERGDVYVAGNGNVYAIRNGRILWQRSFADVARNLVKPVFYDGRVIQSRLQPASVLTVTPKHIFFQADVGPAIDIPGGGQFVTPRWTGLIVLNRSHGLLATSPIPLRDTGGAVVTVNADGRVYAPHGSISTSFAYELLNPALPPGRKISAPSGGLTALRPVNPESLLQEQLRMAHNWRSTNNPEWHVLRKAMPLTLADTVLKGQRSLAEALRIGFLLQRW